MAMQLHVLTTYLISLQGLLFQLMEMGWWLPSTRQGFPTQVRSLPALCHIQSPTIDVLPCDFALSAIH